MRPRGPRGNGSMSHEESTNGLILRCVIFFVILLEFESRYPVLWARERRVSIKTLGLVCVTLSPFSSSIRLRVSISEYMRMYHC
ncbi:hypothetical protein BJV77DRAFT_483456 [Russula vinacea]|nr:hypothetical protein BJV77DRAFT_483456 [Russula vinacea]